MRKLFVTLTLLALGLGSAFLIASPGAGARTTVDGTLTGSVGSQASPNAYVINLSAQTVAPGTYELDITDYATVHNFRFCNLGDTDTSCASNAPVNVATSVGGTGLSTFQVTLTPGTYLYRCDVHSYTLSGILTVSDGSTTGTTTTTTTTTTTSTTTTTPTLTLKILSTKATHKVVTVKVKTNIASQIGATLLDKNSTDLADTGAAGTTATLKLQPAQKLTKGTYTVTVTANDGTTTVTKKKKVTLM